MKRSTAAALLAIAILAVLIRLSPLLRALYWGADFGEYYALTRSLIADGVVPAAYTGWGITYPSFPGMLVLNGAFVLAGASPELAASVLVPALAGLAVLPLFLIALRVTGDDRAGLVAAAFLAVAMFQVYPTSHAVPAALADVLLLGALLLFLELRRSPRFLALLVPTGLAVVVTHHLGTYVLLLVAVASLLLRAALDATLTVRRIRAELAFVVLLAVAAVAFWWSARPFWSLLEDHVPVAPAALLAVAALAVLAVPAAIAVRRRASWRFRPRARSVRGAGIATGLAAATAFGIVGVAIAFPVPGTAIRLEPAHLLLFAPTFLFLALAAAGRRTLDFGRGGTDVTAWFAALVLSTGFGTLVAPEVLIPYRHLEYLAIPVAVMVGAGARWLSLGVEGRAQVRAVAAVGLLVAGTAVAAIPPPGSIAGWDEGIDARSVEAALWLGAHASGLVAADHRASSVVFGFAGLDATWDRETRFWRTEDLAAALDAMAAVPLVNGTGHVAWVYLDDGMRRGLQVSPFAPAQPLLPGEEAKFTGPPFHKLYDSGFAQLYFLNRPPP